MIPATIALFLALTPAANERVTYVVDHLVENGFPRRAAESLFQDPRLKTYPPVTIAPRKVDWEAYIASLVSPLSVRRGIQFLERNQAMLTKAQEQYGVDKEVVAAILRVETNFGANIGRYITFNVFYTQLLRSTEENRWKRAADNLVSLAAYCKRLRQDCFGIKGSYAGAMGPAQFLPHTLEQLGADGNGDGVVNAFQNADAIFSAANFLRENGWQEDQTRALGKYYGSVEGYPRAILAYADALRQSKPNHTSPEAQAQ